MKSNPRAHQRIERLGAELTDLRLEGVHLPWGEHPRHQTAVGGVHRWILEDDHTGRHLDVGPDQLDDPASTGDVGAVVPPRRLHVVVPAQDEEVVLLVVVERVLPLEGGGTSGTDPR